MSHISKWFKHMCTVPARVYFVAGVFALSTVYVSQEAGFAFAQSAGQFQPPPMGGNFQGPPPSGMPQGDGQFGGPQGGQMGNNQFGQPGSQQQQFDQRQMMQPPQGDMNGKQGQMENRFEGQPREGGDQKMGNDQFGQPDQRKQFEQGPMVRSEENQMMNDRSGHDSNEDFDKQQAQREAQQAEQSKKQFAQMKKQFGQMAGMLKKVEARIAAVEKQGVKAPADIREALANAKTALATIQTAQTIDDEGVQEAMDTLRESGQTLGESMQKLEMLSQMPKIMKQAASEIKKLETAYTKAQKTAARQKMDVSSQLAEFRTAIDSIKTSYAEAQQLVQSGDAEGAAEELKSGVWENMQEAYQYPGIIEALSNVRKYVTTFEKFITKASKSKLVKADSDAVTVLGDMRTQVAELKAGKITDPDDIRSAVSDIFDLQSEIQTVMGVSQQGTSLRQSGNSMFDFSAFGQVSGSQGQQ